MKHWNKDQHIKKILESITTAPGTVLTESVMGSLKNPNEITAMRDIVKEKVATIYEGAIDKDILDEDVEMIGRLLENSVEDLSTSGWLNESNLSLATMSASIATIMRTPFETSIHRAFNTSVSPRPIVTVEEVVPTVKAPGGEFIPFVDAFGKGAAADAFQAALEIKATSLATNGVTPGAKNTNMLQGLNSNYKIGKNLKVSKIDVELVNGTPLSADKVRIAKGSSPYFDFKTQTLTTVFEANNGTTWVPLSVNATVDFATGVLVSVIADSQVKKVYFDAPISHEEHTHPIETSFKNSFREFIIPTRPHIEVSLPKETQEDTSKGINFFENQDILTKMTANLVEISSRNEEMRLLNTLKNTTGTHVGEFDFDAPTGFPYGNIEWIKREFIPFMDQVCTALKDEYNLEDCHFRIPVSPYILRYMDVEQVNERNASETAKGAGAINYSISVKTATNVMYFISSQRIETNAVKVMAIPNNEKMSQIRTFNYYKYSSFLTDQLRKASNPVHGAITYTERNQEYIETALSADITIKNMATMKTSGAAFLKRAQ